ncbi:MAG TPA: hypothetical protein DC047_04035 [Blastocatellia bacterium]|nr:hypothetical protein [Blastocatellia bacterium]
MSKLGVHSFSISIDGYGAGPDQGLSESAPSCGLKVFDWFFPRAPVSVFPSESANGPAGPASPNPS